MATQSVALILLIVVIMIALVVVLSAAILHRRRVRMLKEQIPYQMSAQADLQGLASLNRPLFEEHKEYEELFSQRDLVKGSDIPQDLFVTAKMDKLPASKRNNGMKAQNTAEIQGSQVAKELELANLSVKTPSVSRVKPTRQALERASKKDWHESNNLDEELQRIEEELARLQ